MVFIVFINIRILKYFKKYQTKSNLNCFECKNRLRRKYRKSMHCKKRETLSLREWSTPHQQKHWGQGARGEREERGTERRGGTESVNLNPILELKPIPNVNPKLETWAEGVGGLDLEPKTERLIRKTRRHHKKETNQNSNNKL